MEFQGFIHVFVEFLSSKTKKLEKKHYRIQASYLPMSTSRTGRAIKPNSTLADYCFDAQEKRKT